MLSERRNNLTTEPQIYVFFFYITGTLIAFLFQKLVSSCQQASRFSPQGKDENYFGHSASILWQVSLSIYELSFI